MTATFNDAQSRSVRSAFLDIHRRMAELEGRINARETPSPLAKEVNDLSPTEARVVQDYFARIRTAMVAHLKACDIPLDHHRTGLRWALQTGVSFIGIAVEEQRPSRLRGYGPINAEADERATRICEDLSRLVDQVATYLRQGAQRDLAGRLQNLEAARVDVTTLSKLERIITRWRSLHRPWP
jgi:hypothetical protein